MMPREGAPFTNFVMALANSGKTFNEFTGHPGVSVHNIAEQWHLTPEQVEAVRDGNLQQIQEYVAAELGEGAVVSAWVGTSAIPWPWVGTS